MPPKKSQPHITLPTNVGKKRTLEEQPSEGMINSAKVQKIQDGPVSFKQQIISGVYQDWQEALLQDDIVNIDQNSGQFNQEIEYALQPEEQKKQVDQSSMMALLNKKDNIQEDPKHVEGKPIESKPVKDVENIGWQEESKISDEGIKDKAYNNEEQQEYQEEDNDADSDDFQSQEEESDAEMIDTAPKNQRSPDRKAAKKFRKKLNKLGKDQRMLDKKLGPDSFLGYQEDDEDNEQINPGAAAYEDAEYHSKSGSKSPLFNIEKISKRKGKNGVFPSEATKLLIIDLTDTFCKNYSLLGLREHPHFKDWSEAIFQKLEYWYKNQQKKIRKGAHKKKHDIPHILNPNMVLVNLLSDFDIEHRQWIAGMLQKTFPQWLMDHYVNKALDEVLVEIENCMDDINNLIALLQSIPEEVRLKATARAISLLQDTGQYTNEHKRSWFNNCIKPSLETVIRVGYLEFTEDDIKIIKHLCDFNGLQHLEEPQGIAYLTLINSKKTLDLNEAYKHFFNKSNKFWKDVLTEICKVQDKIADIFVQNKSTMITSAILRHYKVSGINVDLANILSHFDKMSEEEISALYDLKEERNFMMLLGCLKKDQKHKFMLFKSQSQLYINIDDESQLKCCQELLPDAPLDQWVSHYNQVIASSAFLKEDDSLKIVQAAIEEARIANGLSEFTEKEEIKKGKQYDEVFQILTKEKRFRKLDWQKEVVVYLSNLLTGTKAKNEIIVTLGTGHGKSLLIQLFADMLIKNNQKVIIVCLNEFLASQGRRRYGSPNIVYGKLEYISIQHFIKRQPEPLTNVIFDEIDSMLGTNSFSLIDYEKTKMTNAFYNISQMQKWKSIVGFSGTISQSTITQIKMEFDEPVCINIPSLRVQGTDNTVSKVVRVHTTDPVDLFIAIDNRIQELKRTDYINYIIIFEDLDRLNQFKASSHCITSVKDKNCIIFDNFTSNFPQIENKLNDVAKDNFLILTTREGARGVDYKGQHVAHVIMAFKPHSLSECVQALGRGCRSLTSSTEGTIICNNPAEDDAAKYLDVLTAADDELSQSFRLNSKIAKMLHGQSVATGVLEIMVDILKQPFNNEPYETFVWFQAMMKRGDNFLNDDQNLIVWNALLKFDKSGKMPEDPNHRWK